MSRGPDRDIRDRCPGCKLTDIYRRISGVYRCKQCGEEFVHPFVGRKTDTVPLTLKGSGVIAGSRTTEFKPLRRNFWEKQDLAMLTRK